MAAFFVLGVVGLILLLLGARGFLNADPKFLAKVLKIAGAVICGGLAVFFLVRGRIDAALMLGALAAASLGYLPRSLLPFNLGSLFGGRGPGSRLGSGWQRARTGNDDIDGTTSASGQQSTVETGWLRMQLEHATGRMDGDVLQGRHAGRRLGSLSFEELILLLRDCQSHDNQAAALLEAYLDRSIGEDWRERAAQGDAGEAASPVQSSAMTREQAWDVLGLQPDASDADIRAAHRRLMKKFHPDQGGSTYLAAQINRAKDLLLGE